MTATEFLSCAFQGFDLSVLVGTLSGCLPKVYTLLQSEPEFRRCIRKWAITTQCPLQCMHTRRVNEKACAILQAGKGSDQINIVLNWFEELKERVPAN